MNYTISHVLSNAPAFKGRQWSMSNEDFSTLNITDGKAPISLAEIEAADLQLFSDNQKNDHIVKRKENYPSVEDQLLAIWASMDTGEIPKSAAFYNAIKAINDQYQPGK